ncbi:MAG: hypothetical protein IKH86_06975 [Prevotella sp.]|nr:hypothetical protein [Prevotella sp.]
MTGFLLTKDLIKHKSFFSVTFLLLFVFCCLGCSSEEYISSANHTIKENVYNDSVGRVNAVKKARQMTDIQFTPLLPILGLGKTYAAGKTYRGMVYSMVSELGNYVGNKVSFHTFMTAVHNPRSKIYTENVSLPPYHGRNCKAYYGTVCSSMVSYALGLNPGFSSRDFHESELMMRIPLTQIDNIMIADVLWKSGHVALVTDVVRDEKGNVTQVEISESVSSGCRRYTKSREDFLTMMETSFKEVLRYTRLYENTNYISIPEFAAVLDEEPVSFQYNDDLCVDKGDKSCYLENEEVVVNIMHSYDYLEVYKDNELYETINADSEDVILSKLPYGDYKARLFYNGQYSDYTFWKIVNVEIKADREGGRLYFYSKNATPLYVSSRDIAGLMKSTPTRKYGFYVFNEEDLNRGYINIQQLNILPEYPYIRVTFSTEYGTIINIPINWNEQ